MIKATGSQLFISNDKLPSNPTKEDYEKLRWVSVGEINASSNKSIQPQPLLAKTVISTSRTIWHIGKIKKPKRQRFGRVIKFRG